MRPNLLAIAFLPALALALDDIPLYLDAGCDSTYIPGSYAQSASSAMKVVSVNGSGHIPVNCKEQLTGTDAAEIKDSLALTSGQYWDFQFKTPVDRYLKVSSYSDIRFWVKNKYTSAANFRIKVQNAAYSIGTGFDTSVVGDGAWHEYVIPLSRVTDTGLTALVFSQPSTLSPDPIDILVDSITITDGTQNGSLAIPATVHNSRPAAWPSHFLIGGLDNQDVGSSFTAYQAGGDYRYQYVMPETYGYYSRSGKGYVYDYAKESDTMGVKTAYIFYNLGKEAEGYSIMTQKLASAAYMNTYFTRYESFLKLMKAAGQKNYMIVLEPDLYGHLMSGPLGAQGNPIDDPTMIAVNMDSANLVSGKTYPANFKGWATYMVQHAKAVLGDSTIVGHMPNHWGVNIPGIVGRGRKEAHIISGMTIARFLNGLGADGIGDVVFVEKADRDAGIKTDADWMWDSTCYAKYFLWTRCIANGTKLPICGWQISEAHSYFSTTAQRDNAVQYLTAHPDRWVDGGFAGILFGAGAAGCTNDHGTTDSGWYRDTMTAFTARKYQLPSITGIQAEKAASVASGISAIASVNGFRLEGWSGEARVRVWSPSGTLLYSRELASGDRVYLTNAHGLMVWNVSGCGVSGSGRMILP
jgi:hypothetical protein